MKNPLTRFIILLPLIIMTGCAKDKEIPKAVILASVDKTQPFVGDSILVSWEVSGKFKALEVRLGDEKISEKEKETLMFRIESEEVMVFYFVCSQLNGEQTLNKITITPKKKAPASLSVGFELSKTMIERGDSIYAQWSIFGTVDSIVSNLPVVEFSLPYGAITLFPDQYTTFTITAYGQGIVKEKSVSVIVNDPLPPVITLVASPSEVRRGYTTSTITWSMTNKVDSIVSNFGVTTSSGSIVVSPSENTIYQIDAYGPGGNATNQVEINVGEPTLTDYLCDGKWYMNEMYKSCPEKNIWREPSFIGDCEKDDTYLFKSDGYMYYNKGVIICEGENPNTTLWEYSLTGDTLYGLGAPRIIKILTIDSLIWEFESVFIYPEGTFPSIVEQVFSKNPLPFD